jgi:hypothetical protein
MIKALVKTVKACLLSLRKMPRRRALFLIGVMSNATKEFFAAPTLKHC